jgi:hypothetical protein
MQKEVFRHDTPLSTAELLGEGTLTTENCEPFHCSMRVCPFVVLSVRPTAMHHVALTHDTP